MLVKEDVDPSTVSYLHDKLKFFSTYMSVPGDFLSYTAKAMIKLKSSADVLYNLAKAIGSLRTDSTTRFPTDCMPIGLIEYIGSAVCPTYRSGIAHCSSFGYALIGDNTGRKGTSCYFLK